MWRKLIDDEIYERVQRLELPWNRYGVDPYGVSQEHVAMFLTPLAWAYRNYFSVNCYGIENVPGQGRGMIVGNHSGGVALDAGMILVSALMEMDPPRLSQGMADKFLNQIPFASSWTNRVGQFTGLPEHAARLLEDDRLLMVFPEGARGTAKLYPERHSLVRFGSGFMRLALSTGSPIIPTAFIGGGEAIPTIHNSEWLGAIVGAPYVPVTPYGVPFPRPVSCQIYYGKPMLFEGDGNEEDEVIFEYVARVKAYIGQLIEFGVQRRSSLNEPCEIPEPVL